jgi:DNA polymerase III subunit epsilon
MYTIVDIETTGGSSIHNRITEIAIYRHDGQAIIDEFVSLINPEVHIPYYITQMTGITNEMVESAPRFFEVAQKVVEITDNAIFVAHNVQFDYRFIEAEFKRLGYNFNRKTLCTVKLSRKIIPGYKSYSLGNICNDLGIKIDSRHRASGDARATVKLFELLLKTNQTLVDGSVPTREKLYNWHPSLTREKIEIIPDTTGIYYLYDEKDQLIYVGKSKSIRTRVFQHLTEIKSKKAIEMAMRIAHIDFEQTGSELIALLLESEKIKAQLPVYNRLGRRASLGYGLFSEVDKKGYLKIYISKLNKNLPEPLIAFAQINDARATILKFVEKYNLCQKLCGLYGAEGSCFHYQIRKCKGACVGEEGAELYNLRAAKAIESINKITGSFVLLDKGRHDEEVSFVKVVKGNVIGYGYFDTTLASNDIEYLTETIIPLGSYRENQLIVGSFLVRANKSQVIYLNY